MFYMYFETSSAISTARHAPDATVTSPFPKYARITAATRPNIAEVILLVAYKIAGKVIAARTAYGT